MAPSVYLLSRRLTEKQTQAAIDALSLTPVDVVIISNPEDVNLARKLSEMVTGLHRPIAILADFDTPLQAINPDGSIEKMNVI